MENTRTKSSRRCRSGRLSKCWKINFALKTLLRHIERNSLLLFLIPADAKDIAEEYKILLNELEQFNPELLDKQRVLAISKSDLLDDELVAAIKPTLPKVPSIFISSHTGLGLMELKDLLWKHLNPVIEK